MGGEHKKSINIGALKFRGKRRFLPGMTLIELMIVLLISIIVLGAAFSVYQVNARYYVAQDALLEQQQNLRSALYSIGRDLRMAGNGLNLLGARRVNIYINDAAFGENLANETGWFQYAGNNAREPGARPVFGTDGGANASDTLTVFHAAIETANSLGVLAADFKPTDNSMTLKDPFPEDIPDNGDMVTVDNGGMLNNGDMIAVVHGGDVVILEAGGVASPDAQPRISIGPRFKPGADLPDASFPEGSSVYRLRDLTLVSYFLEASQLMANFYSFTDGLQDNPFGEGKTGGAVALANDIEDFQVRYILDDQPPDAALDEIVDSGASGDEGNLGDDQLENGRFVRAVRLALVSRSPISNETTAAGRPVTVFNRQRDNEAADGHQRRVLTDTIYLRNF